MFSCSWQRNCFFCPPAHRPTCGTSAKELSLWEAYFLTAALKTAGCLCLDVFILFGTALTKKYAPVLLGCMAAVFLPVYGFSPAIRYALPGPAGFLTASGFLRGKQMTVDKSETILYSMYEHLLVQETDLNDFSERTVLKIRMNEKNLLGEVFRAEPTDWSYYLSLLGFFLDEDYVYFISSGDISRVSRLTGKRKILIEAPQLSVVAYDGRNIFYLNERFRLVKFSLAEQESQVVSDKIIKPFPTETKTSNFTE